MGTSKRIALVTGANRGLGLEVCRQLAGLDVLPVLTSRDERKGTAAAESLRAKGLECEFRVLDVASEKSILECVEWVRGKFGKLEILVNNAGIMIDDESGEWDLNSTSAFKSSLDIIRRTFETNTLGAFLLCQQLIPMMLRQNYGRIVNVLSGMGQLDEMGPGWPAYRISKTALNAVTRIFAAETRGSNVLVNSVSPGWVKTDMGGESAPDDVETGADTLVWAATLPEGGPTGGFFEERARIPW